MFKSIRLSLLAGCIAATCQAWAAPAGDLPLMPWPQQVAALRWLDGFH